MFSSTRLHAFVSLALGIGASAAPATVPRPGLDIGSRLGSNMGLAHAANLASEGLAASGSAKRDLYDLSGGFDGLLLGLGAERYGGSGDEDTYILKRQLDGLDVGSRLGSNTGLVHAANLANEGLAASGSAKRDLYDLSGGIGGLLLGLASERGGSSEEDTYILKRQLASLLFGLDSERYAGEGSDEDVYILKRQLADLGSRLGSNMGLAHAAALGEGAAAAADGVKRDTYDLNDGLVGLLLGLDAERYGGSGDEDTYILKRQLADLGSRLGSNTGLAHAAALGGGAVAAAGGVKRDTYDLSGGLAGLLFGLGAEGYGGSSDEDTYILKRQQTGLDVGSKLSSNMGLAHAAALGEGVVAASGGVKRDVYDLSGDLTGLLLGLGAERYGDSDEDTYILKRQLPDLANIVGSRLGSNMGIAHATGLGEGALGLGSGLEGGTGVESGLV